VAAVSVTSHTALKGMYSYSPEGRET
jgi:hypothetical protein